MKTTHRAALYALLAATLYAVNLPLSKLLLTRIGPTMLAAFLYLGAGLGLCIQQCFREKGQEAALTKKELPYTVGMIVLDIAAPILLMLGLSRTNSASAALLGNFEIVATSCIAFLFFHEVLSRRLCAAIVLVTLASILLSLEPGGQLQWNTGSVLVLGAACCWGLENNCTRMLSGKSAPQITMVKGIFSGCGSLVIALYVGETLPGILPLAAAMVLGFVSYGLSITFYILAQKDLGAAKTSAYYAIAPFLGAGMGMLLLREQPNLQFLIGLAIMVLATVLLMKDSISLQHTHAHVHNHTHLHRHGDLVHSHPHAHTHAHLHAHGSDGSVHGHTHGDIPGHDHPHAAR